ncbi:bifunctional 4-hydroxy-2-oxoglutarate aldolase/2-dehydro-3-deoxy-phosphogluconate aldolase [Falsihalocynthiibacter sp. CO-5D18]|uniref:bifunctional 4-hydroxy-2-oxoglutarate aldolase/2-dehydro-3-deoxy-phosphogluconate aldolase n=1 Tax=Falsihalocynthiibacter sp. CO-5D18 TaxID=3240872 RepID=UPI00350FB43C
MTHDAFNQIVKFGVVPVIAIEHVDHAIPLADALLEAGLGIAEITFRTEAAADVLAKIRDERPDLLIGAGTILNTDQLQRAIDAGAAFGLAPGCDLNLVKAATSAGLPFAPGVMTPTDISLAVAHGCRLMKFFPAMPAGGPSMLSNISAPFKHLGLKFVPTGGVKIGNMQDWLSKPEIAAVGGTWIATTEMMHAGKWAEITANARAAAQRAQEIRQ